MKPENASLNDFFAQAGQGLSPLLETESFALMGQFLDGELHFEHLNPAHDEVILLLEGELEVWIDGEVRSLSAPEVLKLPQGKPHGHLKGKGAKLLVAEGL